MRILKNKGEAELTALPGWSECVGGSERREPIIPDPEPEP